MPSINKTFGNQIRTSPTLTVSSFGTLNFSGATIDLTGPEFIDGIWQIVSGNSNLSNSPTSISSWGATSSNSTNSELTITIRRT